MSTTTKLSQLLGEHVINGKGEKIPVSDLANKPAIGLYFSAHWCGPCRSFTPQLAKIYAGLKENKDFEVIFVSSDRDEASFKDYFGSMPWLALPFDERKLKAKLSGKFKVQGIPTLVILDPATGAAITTDGRGAVMSDPQGENFPWRPKPVLELLGNSFVDKSGKTHSKDDLKLKEKVIGIYFSAHWCPPCKMFTPMLAKTYEKVKADGKNFEVIFVSSDRDQGSFNEYLGEMPWVALPFDKRSEKNDLAARFDVSGIPAFHIIDGATGRVINSEGRAAISSDPNGANFPWKPQALNDLDGPVVNTLNSAAGLIIFVDDSKSEDAESAVQAVAEKTFAAAEAAGEDPPLNFFVARKSDITTRVKSLMSHSSESPVVAILDIPAGGTFYSSIMSVGDVTEGNVQSFVDKYLADSLGPVTPLNA